MKRLVICVLALLILSGCAATEQPAPGDNVSTAPDSWRCEELDFSEAFQAYRAEGTIQFLQMTENGLLVVAGRTLTVLGGADGVPAATEQLETDNYICQKLDDGCACYLPDTNTYRLFDGKLQTMALVTLPEQPEGSPMISPDGATVYYCVGPEIKAYDVELKITRKVKFTTCTDQELTGIYFDGTLLSCNVTYDTGEKTTMYISARDGSETHTDNAIAWMETTADSFILERTDGSVRQLAFGSMDGKVSNMQVPADAAVWPAIAMNGMITAVPGSIAFYDTASGKRTAALEEEPNDDSRQPCITADPAGNCVWFAMDEMIYRWDLEKSAVQDETVYKIPLYTRDNPDTEGLTQCQAKADALSAQHGIRILLAEAAVANPGELTMESEYQIADITAMLEQLEPVLKTYPAEFLTKCAKDSLTVCLVRSVSGASEPTWYWQGATPYIILPTGCDMADGLAMGLGYVVNSRVVSASTKLDKWLTLNPKGFDYGTQPEQQYLEGEKQAFVDAASAISAVEDRSRIFHQAMKPDNSAVFASETMQKKLEMLCTAIRDTWDWKKSTETYPWEQYLTKSLAYQK